MSTSGNCLIYEYTYPPTLRLVSPKPGSSVSSPVKKLEAYARASVSKRNNDLRKGNVKLFINNRSVDFDYYTSGTLIRNSPHSAGARTPCGWKPLWSARPRRRPGALRSGRATHSG